MAAMKNQKNFLSFLKNFYSNETHEVKEKNKMNKICMCIFFFGFCMYS